MCNKQLYTKRVLYTCVMMRNYIIHLCYVRIIIKHRTVTAAVLSNANMEVAMLKLESPVVAEGKVENDAALLIETFGKKKTFVVL